MNHILSHITSVYLLGIGGIGMSALARWFRARGASVAGYDRTPGPLTRKLQEEGITVHFEDRPELVPPGTELVIYTPAIPSDLRMMQAIKSAGTRMLKRSQVLGMLSEEYDTIAVAGTHGKTSITSLIAWIFTRAGIPITAFIGGISRNFSSNLVMSPEARTMIAEADEFDRSFLQLRPAMAVISSMDADHLDIYGSRERMTEAYREFARGVSPRGTLIMRSGLPDMHAAASKVTYGLDEKADCHCRDIVFENGEMHFTIVWKGLSIAGCRLSIPGRHNLENALAATAVSLTAGVGAAELRDALQSYRGVERRFDLRIRRDDLVFIDDYAHHPEELSAVINAVREAYPGRKLTGIFQPHLYSRTRDLADGFARSLDMLDQAILMDIYPARELPIPDVTAKMITRRMRHPGALLLTRGEIMEYLQSNPPEVLLTLGAGDIDRLVPEIEALLQPEKPESI